MTINKKINDAVIDVDLSIGYLYSLMETQKYKHSELYLDFVEAKEQWKDLSQRITKCKNN